MKKLYSLLLILFILPTVFVFTACEDTKNYSMLEFYNTYLAISEESEYLTKTAMPEKFQTENTQIVDFVYSEDLSRKISTISAYSYIDSLYNTMLDDAMGPTYLYGNSLSQAKNLSNSDKEYLYTQLETLKSNYKEIAIRLGDLERTQNSQTASASLAKLYASYEDTILTAINLSSKISSIFYNKIMEVPNVNYIDMDENKINLEEVVIRTLNRLAYYKLAYVDIYFETKILGCDIPNKIINSIFNSVYEPYETMKNKVYSHTIKSDIETKRKQIVELARTLYNLQTVFEDEYSKYQSSCEKIVYGKVDSKSTALEIGHKQIIDAFAGAGGIAYQSYLTVKEILDLCY